MTVIKDPTLRRILRIGIPFIIIPVVAIAGIAIFREKAYLLISMIVAALSVALFIAGFEKKQTGARRMIIVAVMTALCIVGRFIPFFKPIAALTVITGVYLGGEAGFLVGALSAFLSNFYFGQGPWTAFQMLAWGLIGLFAGYLCKVLKKSRVALVLYGVLSGVAYSLIMDVWTVLWYSDTFSPTLYLSAIITALPHTILYAVSNLLFIWIAAKPFGEKLERVKIKYRI